MLIEKLRAAFLPSVTVTAVREWSKYDHEVGVYLLENLPLKVERPTTGILFTCVCGSRQCPVQVAARYEVLVDARASLASLLESPSLDETILEIHRRVQSPEYLGQSRSSHISVDEVAELLDVPSATIIHSCDRLYAEEKLDVRGGVLRDFVRRFRLPKEMAAIMANAAEETLDSSSDDESADRVTKFERKVQRETGLISGHEAFGVHFPRMEKRLLAEVVCDRLATLLLQASIDARAIQSLRRLTATRLFERMKSHIAAPLSARVIAMYVAELLEIACENAEIELRRTRGVTTPQQTFLFIAQQYAELAMQFRGGS